MYHNLEQETITPYGIGQTIDMTKKFVDWDTQNKQINFQISQKSKRSRKFILLKCTYGVLKLRQQYPINAPCESSSQVS